jgi:predicted DNA binding CopG/RHH family protein
MTFLDAEEQDLLESVENDEWQPIPNMREEIQRYQHYARAQIQNLEEVRVELPVTDMRSLENLAQQSGISVSLLVASVMHQYIASQSSPQS